MDYISIRTDSEINELLRRCIDAIEAGREHHGSSYERGVLDTLEWLTDRTVDSPIEPQKEHDVTLREL